MACVALKIISTIAKQAVRALYALNNACVTGSAQLLRLFVTVKATKSSLFLCRDVFNGTQSSVYVAYTQIGPVRGTQCTLMTRVTWVRIRFELIRKVQYELEYYK